MFNFDGKNFEFCWMGLFTTKEEWIHPERRETTYEIMCVLKGKVFLAEGENEYELEPGDLIILRPGVLHKGSRPSHGETSFYWLHFLTDLPDEALPHGIFTFDHTHLFKELMHCRNTPYYSTELVNSVFLNLFYSVLQAYRTAIRDNAEGTLAADVCEWVRINADANLTVEKTASHFGYNSEYLSRLIRKSRGITLKKLIDRTLILRINNLLCNTHYYVKEISDMMHFSDPSAMINFYKYHQKTTPIAYRNKYSMTHMNNK